MPEIIAPRLCLLSAGFGSKSRLRSVAAMQAEHALEAKFHFERLGSFYCAPPALFVLGQIFCVDEQSPATVQALLAGEAGVFKPAVIEEIDIAARVGGPDYLRHGVGYD